MNNFQAPETSEIVPHKTEAMIPLDEFKSLFYQLNAKPDTEIRLLPGRKTLELADIRNINEQVAAKLNNHDTVARIASINFILSNKKIKDYSAWLEFERENWDTVNEKIQTLTIKWDILIKLRDYQLPQRHSMKLRIGSDIPPKDIIQLLFTSDDITELIEAKTSSVCKVDFINNIIAIELLNIVTNWHEGLKNSPEPNSVHNFFKKQGVLLSEIIRYISPVILLVIFCLYSNYLFPLVGIEQEVSIDSLQKVAIFMITIFMIGLFFGFKIERFIDKKVENFQEYPNFRITKGDKNAIDEYENSNKKITKEIVNKIFWIFFSLFISSAFKFILQYFIP
ncbi:MAG: hypothetical protein RMY36_010825 [Nostoc sp. SerVER01]|nr:hypothetical protein [Nostoc sp. SerVER01]